MGDSVDDSVKILAIENKDKILTREEIAEIVRSWVRQPMLMKSFREMVKTWLASLSSLPESEYFDPQDSEYEYEPEAWDAPLPFPTHRFLALEEEYVILACLYDRQEIGERIVQLCENDSFEAIKARIPYLVLLKDQAEKLQSSVRLMEVLSDVKGDIEEARQQHAGTRRKSKTVNHYRDARKELAKTEKGKITIRRLEFIAPRVEKHNWKELFTAFIQEYPNDRWAKARYGPDAMRLWYEDHKDDLPRKPRK